MELDLSKYNFLRLAYKPEDLNTLNTYFQNVLNADFRDKPSYKVGVLMVAVNAPYWPYLGQIKQDMAQMFLPGHQVDYHVWTDNPEEKGENVYPIEPIEWPHGTLMRYNLFLQQEEVLEKYDYLFYIDIDMRMVNVVGDEILGEGLTMAEHPMYAIRKEYVPPYEPNKNSTAFVPRLGMVVSEGGKNRLKPLYAAGGFQGGKTKDFLEAMKVMRKNIDADFTKNYIAIWNDESHWNKYLYDYSGPLVALSPSYIYPDSLINEYYVKVWGCNYPPKIITLTKPFSTTKEAGTQLREKLQTI